MTASTYKFKHSGNLGDLIYGLALVRYLGGGELYLHLNQIDTLSRKYYGVPAPEFHKDKLSEQDYLFLKDLILAQDYIREFKPLDKTCEVTHNLDRFRDVFIGHPGNYVDIYADTFGIMDPAARADMRTTPWLTVPQVAPVKTQGKIVVNRTARWRKQTLPAEYLDLDPARVVFVGLESEYREWCSLTASEPEWLRTDTALELAQAIAGADEFWGNQSLALSLSLAMGQTTQAELREDLPRGRNECWFPNQPRTRYI